MFIAAGANRQPGATAYEATNQVLAFGCGNLVALWPVVERSISHTFTGHTKPVTAVVFLDANTLVTGSSDCTVRIWDLSSLRCTSTISFEGSVLCLAATESMVVVGSADGSISIYRWSTEMNLIDTIKFKDSFYPLCSAIYKMPSHHIVAVGGTANHIYIVSINGANETKVETTVAGHENWLKSLDFTTDINGDVILASGSQDRYVRVWRVHKGLVDVSQRTDVESPVLSNKVHSLLDGAYSLVFDALIMGHEDWVVNVSWSPYEPMTLLSTSSDASLMIWRADHVSGVWVCTDRLGDVSIKGASTATGASGGFWGGLWIGPNMVGCVSRSGSWRIWEKGDGGYASVHGITGHTKAVTSMSWSPQGQYLLTTSLDQTTRLFAEYQGQFCEMSRPQIHGYDMVAIACLSDRDFVSAGDEKIVRVFTEPRGIAHLLENVCGIVGDKEGLAESATVPALGLSNKQQQDRYEKNNDQDEDNEMGPALFDVLSQLSGPPLEEHLQRQTLWPEVEKLYGHGYEVCVIAVSHDKQTVATCCKSNTEAHAVIRLYDTKTWQARDSPLACHSLTVTSLAFSPNDNYLLSVSRDRQWALWKRCGDNYSLMACQKAHSRIVWDCTWLSNDIFATASRDKLVKLWRVGEEACQETQQLKFDEVVTALAYDSQHGLLACGLDTGTVLVKAVTDGVIGDTIVTEPGLSPSARVAQIRWRPCSNTATLGVASDDGSVRIAEVTV